MKSIFNKIFVAIALICALGSCESNDADNYGDAECGYGSDLTVRLIADFSETIPLESIICDIRSAKAEDLLITATHSVVDGESCLTLSEALPIGANVLREVRYTGDTRSDYTSVSVGCTINVQETINELKSKAYDKYYGLYGSGTDDDPYEIASASNFAAINMMESTDYFFEQSATPIDFLAYYGHESGFEGICPEYNKPFKGVFKGAGSANPIKNLAIRRFTAEQERLSYYSLDYANPVGLFACVSGAMIKDIYIDNPDLSGDSAVGGVVGVVLGVSAAENLSTTISNCHLLRSDNADNDNRIFGSVSIGGIVGCIEYMGSMTIEGCSVAKEVVLAARSAANGGGSIGGIVGSSGLSAEVVISGCENNAPITGDGVSSLGGIIGAAEKIKLLSCTNNADVIQSNGSSSSFATGGLIGGASDVTIIGSTNYGKVSGTRGVGGIVGSSVFDTSDENPSYGNVALISTHNYGSAVLGTRSVGGLIGEAQASLTNCYNCAAVSQQSVSGVDYSDAEVGGLVGFGAFMVSSNSHNIGAVDGVLAGGLAGQTEGFFIYGSSNFAPVNGSTLAGGLIGKTSEYGLINYAINYGDISGGADENSVGGLVGSLGEHLSSSDKLSAWGDDAIEDAVMFSIKLVTEGSCTGAEEFIGANSKCKPAEVIVGHVPWGWEIYEIVEAIMEGCESCMERDEEREEFAELPEQMKDMAYDTIETMDSSMKEQLTNLISPAGAVSKYAYSGAMPLSSSKDITAVAFDNMMDFSDAINSRLNDGDRYADLTENSQADLVDLTDYNTEVKYEQQIAVSVVKCVLAAAGMIATGGMEISRKVAKETISIVKFSYLAGSSLGVVLLDGVDEAIQDGDNTIIINQGMNFGRSGGHGLVGSIGDRLAVRNSLSAGPYSGSAVSNYADNKNIYDSSVVCIGNSINHPYGDKNADDSSMRNFYCYGDGSNGTYSASDMGAEGTYGKDNVGDAGSDPDNWDWGIWDLSYGIPLPSNSRYLTFQ